MMNRINLKGITIAVVVDHMLTLLAVISLLVLFLFHAVDDPTSLRRMTDQELDHMVIRVTASQDFLLCCFFFGTLTTILGGYIAARIAKKAPYLNSGIVGLIGLATGSIAFLISDDCSLDWFAVSGLLITIPASLLGGYLGRAQ